MVNKRKNPLLLGKKSTYKILREGEWAPISSIFACCDCGLVHRYEYKIVGRDGNDILIEYRMFRDKRRTAAIRRGRKKEILKRIDVPINSNSKVIS